MRSKHADMSLIGAPGESSIARVVADLRDRLAGVYLRRHYCIKLLRVWIFERCYCEGWLARRLTAVLPSYLILYLEELSSVLRLRHPWTLPLLAVLGDSLISARTQLDQPSGQRLPATQIALDNSSLSTLTAMPSQLLSRRSPPSI